MWFGWSVEGGFEERLEEGPNRSVMYGESE